MIQAAILTGDLIGSTAADSAATETALALLAEVARRNGAARFTRFRGDGWQCATALPLGPRLALRLACALTAARGLQSRIAIGLGAVEAWGEGALLSQSRGPALIASGRALDGMATGQLLALANGDSDPRDQALIRLWAALARRWSPEQAEALGLSLEGLRQTEIAARLGISKQAVSLRLKGAEALALTESLTLWEAAMTEETRP